MKHLKPHWQLRSFLILLISAIASILLISLEFTDWAAQINIEGYSHGEAEGERPNIPTVLMYILPFIKVFVLVTVPMFLTLLIIKLWSKFIR